ncbi:hypothetical protein [Brevibacillus dissolubilis]|uniref:hypothetical protein n=1 Tax=Brevibacillus dissolubilis TaxID=1844116 RepID=UPI001116715E|nr:hypothetical protein [Brevibacillus dissolubilis]
MISLFFCGRSKQASEELTGDTGVFYKEALEVIDILEDAISHTDRFFDEERAILNMFSDKEYGKEENKLQIRIIEVKIDYFATVDVRNPENPKNPDQVKKLLKELDSIRSELEEKFKQR